MDELGITDVKDGAESIFGWAAEVEECLNEVDTMLNNAYSLIEDNLRYIKSDEVVDDLQKAMGMIADAGIRLEDI